MTELLVRLRPLPELRQPILLTGFDGWGDAGSAATLALQDLLGDQKAEPCCRVDPSSCFDYTVARPLTVRGPGHDWSLEWPDLALYPLSLPRLGRDLLIFSGPEPHFRWPELAAAVAAYAFEAGVRMALTLGAYVGAVSHRAAPVSRRTLDKGLEKRMAALHLEDTNYEGPTAFATALLHACQEAGIPAGSLWVATPPYLQAGNPVAALALVEAAAAVTGLPLETGRVREAAATFMVEVDRALEDHPELADQLRELMEAEADGRQSKTLDLDRPPPDAPPGLPSGKALVEAVEHYLRQARRDPPQRG